MRPGAVRSSRHPGGVIQQSDLNSGGSSLAEVRQTGDDSRAWAAFASAASREAFCRAWLELQCSMVPDVKAALLLLKDDEAFVPAAVWPDARRDVSYLAPSAEQALTERRGLVVGINATERTRVAAGSVYVA